LLQFCAGGEKEALKTLLVFLKIDEVKYTLLNLGNNNSPSLKKKIYFQFFLLSLHAAGHKISSEQIKLEFTKSNHNFQAFSIGRPIIRAKQQV